jgi:predicted MPP superfamily phosphohydrolase
MIITRRALLALPLGAVGTAGAVGAYGVLGEPLAQPEVTRYSLQPPRWPTGLNLRVAAIADLHACDPWMSIERIEAIVEQTNALSADLVVLLGDYVAGHKKITAIVPDAEWARALAGLKAPLGVYAVMGNHDWWDDPAAQRRQAALPKSALALETAGIPVLHNRSIGLEKNGQPINLAGLGDQMAFRPPRGEPAWKGLGTDDLALTLSGTNPAAPTLLLAHEPDIFPSVPEIVSLTLAGHTHGGQVRILGHAPVVPSRFGNRYVYGHVVEDNRHLIVSGGLGCTWWPIRIGSPPEIVLVELSGSA